MITQDTILSILKDNGASLERLDGLLKYSQHLVDKAVEGKSVRIVSNYQRAGKSYGYYSEVALNYTGTDAERPVGMNGLVKPKELGTSYGVNWATFHYDIDSGD